MQNAEVERADLQKKFFNTIGSLAGALVPWEIVAAPIPFKDLPRLYPLIEDLRDSGAAGTRLAPHYAFGVHLNPELPALDANTILRYLQAYCCFYDWIKETEKTDFSRRITPYIDHFSKAYVTKILAPNYAPTVAGTSTAAAIWSTGAVGIAVGLGRIEIAVALSIMTFFTLRLVGEVKKDVT